MNHTSWRSARSQRLASADTTEYEKAYEDARLSFTLGQMVYDRRTELGLTQTELAQRAGMKQPAVSRIEGGGTVPTVPLLRRLADALDADLNISFTPRSAAPPVQEPDETAGVHDEQAEAEECLAEPEIVEAVEQDELYLFTPMLATSGGRELSGCSLNFYSREHAGRDLAETKRRALAHAAEATAHLLEYWLVQAVLMPVEGASRESLWRSSRVLHVLAREPSERRTEHLRRSVQSLQARFDSLADEVETEAERLADA